MRLLYLLFTAMLITSACRDNTGGQATSNTPLTAAGDSTSRPQYITLGGVPQAVLIRGVDTTNPVLLLLHGGPGFTEMALFATYNKDLEKDFIVVNWDQRGAGLSYDPSIPDSTMNIQQFVNDAHELVSWLKKRYNKEKIYVLGHSWGSILGINLVQQYPRDFHAFVGVGQGVHMLKNESISFQFTLDTAIADNNTAAIKELKSIQARYPPNGPAQLEDLKVQRKWLSYYGGAIYQQKNADKIFSRIQRSGNPLYDSAKANAGNDFTFSLMLDDLMSVDLFKTASKLEVPAYFVTGRHDYNTPFSLVEDYVNMLDAPHKEIVWFENSAHWIPFEEPGKLYEVMVNKVRKHSHPNASPVSANQ